MRHRAWPAGHANTLAIEFQAALALMDMLMTEPFSKEPQNCSPAELTRFLALAKESGEVSVLGLDERIRAAFRLVFCENAGEVIGIAAIKNPLDSYRFDVSRKSGVKLPQDQWPYELGWVFVTPAARKKGLSIKLVACAMSGIEGAMFATSRTDNEPMHATLRHFDFVARGDDYGSKQGQHRIQLFTRASDSEVRNTIPPTP